MGAVTPQPAVAATAQGAAQGVAQSSRIEVVVAAWASVAGALVAALLTCAVTAGAVLASYNALGDVGHAAHIPDLPGSLHTLAVSLDGLAGVALFTLLVLQCSGTLRTYCWALVGGCIAISMAANGAHAIFDGSDGTIVLPTLIAFLVSTVPAASAACALHLALRIGQRTVELLRTALRATLAQPAPLVEQEPPAQEQRTEQAPRSPRTPDAAHPAVADALRTGRGYRKVMAATRWGRPRAEAALRAAREAAQEPAEVRSDVRTSAAQAVAA